MPTDRAFVSSRHSCLDQPVVDALMIPLAMIVLDEFAERSTEVPLTHWNHPAQTLFFDRSHEPFGVRVRVGCLKRRAHDMHPSFVQQPTHAPAPLLITVTDQQAAVTQQAIGGGQRAGGLAHEQSSGCGVDPTIWTRRDARSITKTV